MDANFTQNKAMSAIMPKLLSPMLARLSLRCANCAKTDSGTRKPLPVPESHIPLGYGTGTAAWILTLAKHVTLAAVAQRFLLQ